MLECSSPRSTSASTANPHSWCALAARCPCWPESRCSRPEIPTSPEAAARTSHCCTTAGTDRTGARSVPAVEQQCEVRAAASGEVRSEEHTSELQSRLHLVCRLLLEKKKQRNN